MKKEKTNLLYAKPLGEKKSAATFRISFYFIVLVRSTLKLSVSPKTTYK